MSVAIVNSFVFVEVISKVMIPCNMDSEPCNVPLHLYPQLSKVELWYDTVCVKINITIIGVALTWWITVYIYTIHKT